MARVILVDDELGIRTLFREFLESAGHTVFAEASSMEDAKRIVVQCVTQNIFPVFVVDGAFPVRGQGAELAAIIRKAVPGARVISCSGDPQDWGDVNLPKGPAAFRELSRAVSSLVSD